MAGTMVQLEASTMGYEAKPQGDGPSPGVIIVHEITGLNAQLKEVADNFAARGFAALAVDFFEGQTPSGMQDGAPLLHRRAYYTLVELPGVERGGVGEVEAQLVRAHGRASLADVIAKDLPERRVQQMGRGVVAHGRVAGAAVHLGLDAGTGLEA